MGITPYGSFPELEFSLSFDPIADLTWTYGGDCSQYPYECWGDGVGPIVGGTVTGSLYNYSSNYTLLATLSGSITGGSAEREWWEVDLATPPYQEYHASGYSFVGTWTNGWKTSGYASSFEWTDSGTAMNLASITTTATPEPSSLALLGSGFVDWLTCCGAKGEMTRLEKSSLRGVALILLSALSAVPRGVPDPRGTQANLGSTVCLAG